MTSLCGETTVCSSQEDTASMVASNPWKGPQCAEGFRLETKESESHNSRQVSTRPRQGSEESLKKTLKLKTV